VDLTAYVEKHEFVFDAVLDQYVSNDEVSCKLPVHFEYMYFGDFGSDANDDDAGHHRCIVQQWSQLYPQSFSAQRQHALHMGKQASMTELISYI